MNIKRKVQLNRKSGKMLKNSKNIGTVKKCLKVEK